jgi:D-alanine-D-alanine ligase
VPDVAVIFGGPSPEHDVSVLTGLQACRGIADSDGFAGRLRGLFWSKTGDWYEVDP